MRKKILLTLILISTITLSVPAFAENTKKVYDPGFVMLDILVYRPLGLAVTIVGTGLFVAMSPLTAMAQIAPPHDAFEKTADILIVTPGEYTFTRPVGDRSLAHY
jgi:hypothetical protein